MKTTQQFAKLKIEVQGESIMENTQEKRSVGELINLAFRAVALGMSVAAIVLGVLGTATPTTLITLLAIGLFCLAVTSLK
jgi:hypothetical protein